MNSIKLASAFLSCVLFVSHTNTLQAETPEKTFRLEPLLESNGIEFKASLFGGFNQFHISLDGVPCIIVEPKTAADVNPWVWRARFWGHEPQFDRAMLELGWHVCYCDVSGLFGSDAAIGRWNHFYQWATKLGLSRRPFLEGMSRGGLIIMRWSSAHPNQVCGIYADNAVMDFNSWPGGKGTGKYSPNEWAQCLAAYGLNEEQAKAFQDGPLDRLAPLAKAKVPVFVLINEADNVVPPSENGDLLVEKYKQLGGPITVMRRPGLGHHPHSLKDPAVIVAFAKKAFETAR